MALLKNTRVFAPGLQVALRSFDPQLPKAGLPQSHFPKLATWQAGIELEGRYLLDDRAVVLAAFRPAALAGGLVALLELGSIRWTLIADFVVADWF